MKATIITDGSCNDGVGGWAYHIDFSEGSLASAENSGCVKDTTSNTMEYEAIIMGVQAAIDNGADDILVLTDSQLVIGQMTKGWKVNFPHLSIVIQQLKTLAAGHNVQYIKATRERVETAHKLAEQARLENMP